MILSRIAGGVGAKGNGSDFSISETPANRICNVRGSMAQARGKVEVLSSRQAC